MRALNSLRVVVCLVSVGVTSASSVASGQEVRGTTKVYGQNRPLPTASVVLVDSTGHIVSGTLSNGEGLYAVRATRPGTYRLRIRHVGFAPDTTQLLRLSASSPVTYDPSLKPIPTLPALSVRATQTCRLEPGADEAAVQIWDATQSALTATLFTPEASHVGFVVHQYEREIDGATNRVVREKSWESRVRGAVPYASIPAESLAAYGFVRRGTASSVYYAPDAAILVSGSFVSSHCFRAVSDIAHPQMVGLTFTPNSARTAPVDVAGTLWLDRASGELRYLEFRYQRHDGSRAADAPAATGRVEYEKVPDKGWIVSRWRIAIPIIQQVAHATPVVGGSLGSTMTVATRTAPDDVRIFESGGAVLSTFSTDSVAPAAVPQLLSVVDGHLLDSATGQPIRGGRVRLTQVGGSERRITQSDSVGGFTFDSVTPGAYTLQAAERDSSLDVSSPSSILNVAGGTRLSLTLTISPRPVASALCPGGLAHDAVVIYGHVLEKSTGAPAAGVSVRIRWSDIRRIATGRYSVTPEERLTSTSSSGRYAVCGIPRNATIFASAARGAKRGGEVKMELAEKTDAQTLDLQIP